jgi:uncharacterized protein YjiS (DUF1127 family)
MYATAQSGQVLPGYATASATFGPAASKVAQWIVSLRNEIARRKQARMLAALDNRTLADIGILRSEIDFVAHRVVSGENWRSF